MQQQYAPRQIVRRRAKPLEGFGASYDILARHRTLRRLPPGVWLSDAGERKSFSGAIWALIALATTVFLLIRH